MQNQKKYVVVIAGPTAVGKTALGIQLAKHYNTVVLNADSRQFYKEISIGTAKPSPEELNELKHYFINSKSITELYGAGHFEKDAIELLNELFITQQLVFVVGGSGLYIDALLNGVDEFIDVPLEIRNELNYEFEKNGLNFIQNKLKELDEVYYNSVDLSNSQRIIRALEVCIYSSKPYSSFLKTNKVVRNFEAIKLFINKDRSELYASINSRVEEMMKSGLLEEVKSVQAYRNCNALKTVGYKELFDFLDGNFSLETAVDKIKQHTRNYAKRQITWFKNKDEFEEFSPNDFEKIKGYIDVILTYD